jgi:hypothetical protein
MDSEQTNQLSKNKSLINIEDKGLLDSYKDTFDPKLSFDLLDLHTTSLQNFSNFIDHYHVWESNLAKFVIPQVYNFPEFVSWCMLPIPRVKELLLVRMVLCFVLLIHSQSSTC